MSRHRLCVLAVSLVIAVVFGLFFCGATDGQTIRQQPRGSTAPPPVPGHPGIPDGGSGSGSPTFDTIVWWALLALIAGSVVLYALIGLFLGLSKLSERSHNRRLSRLGIPTHKDRKQRSPFH